MWKHKKIYIIGAIISVLLIIGIASIALAQTNDSETSQNKSFAARVAVILGIDQQRVEDAFTQARKEMANEALDNRLKQLVESGKITQSQADEYRTWWQSRPEGILKQIGPGSECKPQRGFGMGRDFSFPKKAE